jgi:hypothetical protein
MDESVVKHLERPQIGTLKLSEAIRIGAKIRPQGFCQYFYQGRSCALGAAFEAITTREAQRLTAPMWTRLGMTVALHDEVVQRNDKDRWTREQIAD